MRGALLSLAKRIQLKLQADQAEVIPQALTHQDDFSVDVRASKAQRFDTYLMELAVAAALRLFVAEHRTRVPESLRTVVQQVVLDHSAHSGCGPFRAHRQLLAIQAVGEGVHLLLDDVRHLADAAHEQLRLLDDGRANLLVTVSAQHAAHRVVEVLPQRGVAGQQVIHAFDASDLLRALLFGFAHDVTLKAGLICRPACHFLL